MYMYMHVRIYNYSNFIRPLQLKKELDAFDPSFFEEIEDLKFNYQECVRRNVQLEEQMTQQYGVTIETAENV